MEKKFYFITYWQKRGGGVSHDVCWEPVPFVSEMHPAEWIDAWKRSGIRDRVIATWQEISKEDFDAFRKAFN